MWTVPYALARVHAHLTRRPRALQHTQVCQALARLSANEDNKPILTREGGVGVLAEVLCADEHARKAITVKYCVEALWNLVRAWCAGGGARRSLCAEGRFRCGHATYMQNSVACTLTLVQ